MLSVFIICKDEARIIAKTLERARLLADELVIVDSGSTDGTIEIAKSYADKFVHQDWLGYSAQKNFALGLCSHEWVLSLDADEVLTETGIEEIRSKLKAPEVDAYSISRKLFIGNKFIKYGGYFPDYQLRLFRRGIGKFNAEVVHESVELKPGSKVSKLIEPLEHYAYVDLADMQKSFENFASLANANQGANFISLNPLLMLFFTLKFAYVFLQKYFLRLGFLHGKLGFDLALMHAQYTIRKYS